MDDLKIKREQKIDLLDRYQALVSIAAKQELTQAQKSEERGLRTQIEELTSEISALESKENLSKRNAFNKIKTSTDSLTESEENIFDFQILKKTAINTKKPIQDFVLRNYDIPEDLQKANVYSVIAAMATGKPKDEITKRAMNHVTKGATSSVMLTEFLSSQLLDGGLSHSHLAKSGMSIFTMEEPTVRFVKIGTYPTFEWKTELATTTDKSAVFDDVQFDTKTLRGFVNVSGEQLQDAKNIDKSLRTVFSRSIGNSIDTAGLFGSGVGAEPQGIVHYSDVNNYALNDAIENYDPWIHAMKLIADENGDPESTIDTSIMSPSAWRDLNLLKESTTDAPLARPAVLANHRFLHTTKVPTNLGGAGNKTEIVMGGFSSLNLGVRLQTDIIITPVQADKYQYSFFVVFRGDFKPTREQDFAVISGVYAPDIIT